MRQTTFKRNQRTAARAGKVGNNPRSFLGITALLALLVNIPPAHAGPLNDAVNRVENKVEDIQGKVNTIRTRTGAIVSSTDGLQDLVGNVQGITSGFQPEVFVDILAALQDAQALLDLAKSQAADAVANQGNHPDLVALVVALEDLLKVMLGDAGNNVNLGVLTDLLAVLPEQARAVAGQALLTAGIDQALIDKLVQVTNDLPLLLNLVNDAVTGDPNKFLPFGTNCSDVDVNRDLLRRTAAGALSLAVSFKGIGSILEARAKTTSVANEKQVGIHGYVNFNVDTDLRGGLGKFLSGSGDVLAAIAGSGFLTLRHCEILFYQQTLLNEMCLLTRGRSQSCQRWLDSPDVAPFGN